MIGKNYKQIDRDSDPLFRRPRLGSLIQRSSKYILLKQSHYRKVLRYFDESDLYRQKSILNNTEVNLIKNDKDETEKTKYLRNTIETQRHLLVQIGTWY